MQDLGDFPDGRFERKYLVPDNVAVALREALMSHLDLDEHMPAGPSRGYAVYSLYLDSPALELYRHTRTRQPTRIKLRVRYYDNDRYEETGELFSLFCAENEMKGRTIVLYGDIIFETGILEKLLKSPADITLVVDLAWSDQPEKGQERHLRPDLVKLDPAPGKNYLARFIMPEGETAITQIGQHLPAEEAHGEFVGMAMFSEKGARIFTERYHASSARYKGKGFHEAGEFIKASFPDLIQEIIDSGVTVQAVPVYKGWMEVDTFEDYQRAWAYIK